MSEKERQHLVEVEAGIPFEFKKVECIWKEEKGIDTTGDYTTTCGNMFSIIEGNPKDNGFRYCPYCSKVIKEQETK